MKKLIRSMKHLRTNSIVILLTLFGFLGLSQLALAEDPVYFADANLKAAVESELGITDPTPTDMLFLTYLWADSGGISNLTGIEYASNLTYLSLNRNQITDISAVSGLTHLTHLLLRWNQITDIPPFTGFTSLTTLALTFNGIRDISGLSGLTSLTTLYLAYNQISDISPLSGLTSLVHLSLDSNQISNIAAVSGFSNLRYLSLSSNQLSDISAVSDLTSLRALLLWYNEISDISAVSGLTNLEQLDLQSNEISDISAVSGLTNLTQLDLQSNEISDISAVSGLMSLWSLKLMNNPLNLGAYCIYLPLIENNNPEIVLKYDPNPYPPEACFDSDDDGILDFEDNCSESSLDETIIVKDCDSEVYNQLFDDGCTMSDLITECANDAKNHGEFISCLSHLTNDWKNQNLINKKDKVAIQNCFVH